VALLLRNTKFKALAPGDDQLGTVTVFDGDPQVPNSNDVYVVELTVTDDGESGVNPGSCIRLGEALAVPPMAASDAASSGTATALAGVSRRGLARRGRVLLVLGVLVMGHSFRLSWPG
jgi:hypothetical protein